MKYNAYEILEIAKKIEVNGADFYRFAASKVNNPKAKELLEDLAQMEDVHESIFKDMMDSLSGDNWSNMNIDTNSQMFLYLQNMADNVVFDMGIDKMEVHKFNNINQIFKFALEKEKSSVLYYLGIKNVVPDNLGKDKIDNIIEEEMKHIAILSDARKKFAEEA